jgi:hypothetical protein
MKHPLSACAGPVAVPGLAVEHGRLPQRTDMREKREIQRVVELYRPHEGDWIGAWVTFDGERWYESRWDTGPMDVVEVPEGPGVSFDDLKALAKAQGATLHDTQTLDDRRAGV